MIRILLEDRSFEQDIRELLMAFYPGETFTYQGEGENCFLTVRQKSGELADDICLEDCGGLMAAKIERGKRSRLEAKNLCKRIVYRLLREKTGRELPWGTLTGIRPVKIAAAGLDRGNSLSEISQQMQETYLTSADKADLCARIAAHEKELLTGIDCGQGYSLYIGIPFCPTTCLYCSFPSFPIGKWRGRTGLYLDALFHEMEYVSREMRGRPLSTVYIGGGTPTSLSPEDLERLLSAAGSLFDTGRAAEFTVEAGRPDSITAEKLELLQKHGVTRISVNPQTMNQRTLDIIGRLHTVEMVGDCFRLARRIGFDNINMDLIAGLPGEDIQDLRHTMEKIRELDPDGVTVHSLAVKRAARLNMQREEYEFYRIVNTQEMIDLTARCAAGMGMEPYYLYRQKNMAGNLENVGYAKPGKACIYNILIMEEKQTIVGCGAGTATKVVYPLENRLERVENVKNVEQYIDRIGEMLERKKKLGVNIWR